MSELESVLAAHENWTAGNGVLICACDGVVRQVGDGTTSLDECEDAHRTHVADAIRAHLVERARNYLVRDAIHQHVSLLPSDDIYAAADAAVHAYLQAIGDQP